jgi:hypothetical protein
VTAPAKSLSVTFPSHAMFTQPLTLPVSLFCHYSALSQDLLSSLSLSLSLCGSLVSGGISKMIPQLPSPSTQHSVSLARSLALLVRYRHTPLKP